DYAHSLIPPIAFEVTVIATVGRVIRPAVLDVLGQDHVFARRARAFREAGVIIKHVPRHDVVAAVTVVGPVEVGIVTRGVVTEQIFGVPGLGEQFTLSILVNDYSVIMGITLFFSVIFILVVFIVDILYVVLDPRITLGGKN